MLPIRLRRKNPMKCVARTLAAFSILAALAAPAASQEVVHWDVVDDIRTEGLDNSQVMEYAGYLTDVIGPRLTASPNMREAQEYVMDQLRALGLSAIVKEPWGEEAVGWEVQRVSVHMTAPDYQMVIAYPYALTPGTDGPIVTQAVNAVIETRADLAKYRGRLDGAIVLATPPMPTSPRFVQDAFRHTDESLRVFETEGRDVISQTYARGQLEQSTFRREGISEAEVEEFYASEGVAVVLKASIGGDGTVSVTGHPTTSGNRTRAAVEAALPTLAVAAEHYNRLYRLNERGLPVTMEVDVRVAIDETDTRTYNVFAEIPGTDLAHEIVGIGAHLDSWHSGTGATDNAGGVSVMLEAMRILKSIDVQPRRTIRVFLWSYEEGGLRGSRGYVKNHLGNASEGTTTPAHDNFSVYLNTDNGTGQARGVHLQGNRPAAPIFEAWMKPFLDLGVETLSQFSNRATDHQSFNEAGLPGFQLLQDRIDYRARTHHFSMDNFDQLLPRDLAINATVIASFAYHAAMREGVFPRPR
jgi:carboxypeptidase Q